MADRSNHSSVIQEQTFDFKISQQEYLPTYKMAPKLQFKATRTYYDAA